MLQLPDTPKRADQLPQSMDCCWNESGYRCTCGNPLLIGSKRLIVCHRCLRYWERDSLRSEE